MDKPQLEAEILNIVHLLKPEEQQQVLDFARTLPGKTRPRGVPASQLFKLAEGLFEKADVEEMMKAIEEDCERIDYDGW